MLLAPLGLENKVPQRKNQYNNRLKASIEYEFDQEHTAGAAAREHDGQNRRLKGEKRATRRESEQSRVDLVQL